MAHDMVGPAGALMIVMMLAMSGLTLAYLARHVNAAGRERIRHTIRRLVHPTAGTGNEATR